MRGQIEQSYAHDAFPMIRFPDFPNDFPISRFLEFLMCAPGFATASSSPPPIPRSPRCALYTTTRVQSTLVTHAARVRASPATHVLSHCNTRFHVNMQGWVLVSLAIG